MLLQFAPAAAFALVLLVKVASAQDFHHAMQLHDTPLPIATISFVTGGGRILGVGDFKGKVVLLNIWASWCGPCRREMATLDRLQARLGGPDFDVVPLSIDRAGIEPVRQFYVEIGIAKLGIYLDSSGKAARDLGAFGLPTTLLLGRDGQEIGRLVGPAEWDSPELVALMQRVIASTSNVNTKENAQ